MSKKPRTHCLKGHPLLADNMYVKKNGERVCKKCRADYARKLRRIGKGLKFPLLLAMRHVLRKPDTEDKTGMQKAYRKMMEASPKEFMKDYARMEEMVKAEEIRERHAELEALKEQADKPVIDRGSDTAVAILEKLINEYRGTDEKKASLKRSPVDGRFTGANSVGEGEAVVGVGTGESSQEKE